MSELPKISELLKKPEKMRVMCGEACGATPRLDWQVMNGDESASCMSGEKHECEEWLARIQKEYPDSDYSKYHVGAWKRYLHYDTSLDAMAEAEATLTDEEYRAYAKLFIQQAETLGRSAENKSRMIISAHAIDRLVNFLIAKGLAQP